jgi:pescadillo protein
VTWISPYKFSIHIPNDVDFRVMDTFLLFYTKLLGFVNFSLYTGLNLQYPPRVDESREKNDNGLSALILEPARGGDGPEMGELAGDMPPARPSTDAKVQARMATLRDALPDIETKVAEVGGDEDEGDLAPESDAAAPLDAFPAQMEGGEEAIENIEEAKQTAAVREKFASLFKGLSFFVSREAPRYSLEFVVPAFGGAVSWEGVGDDELGAGPYGADDKRVTHHIVDRPTIASPRVDRHYVQPQWVYDCINCQKLLPTAPYVLSPRSNLCSPRKRVPCAEPQKYLPRASTY